MEAMESRADGLERFYDVVIVGTGLVEAMLSAYVHIQYKSR